jgi:hypothetical protein
MTVVALNPKGMPETATIRIGDVRIGHISTENEFMYRHQSSMHHPHLRASDFFSHLSFLTYKYGMGEFAYHEDTSVE